MTISSSDIRLKTNINNMEYGLSTVLQMNPVQFNWKDKNNGVYPEIGFIAQEIQILVPEVIGTNIDTTLSLDYSKLVPVLVNAIKELSTEVATLKNTVNYLSANSLLKSSIIL